MSLRCDKESVLKMCESECGREMSRKESRHRIQVKQIDVLDQTLEVIWNALVVDEHRHRRRSLGRLRTLSMCGCLRSYRQQDRIAVSCHLIEAWEVSTERQVI